MGVQTNCFKALFNLDLVNFKMDLLTESRKAFERLNVLKPNHPCVLYQIANLQSLEQNYEDAIKWLNILIMNTPSDPSILSFCGDLHGRKFEDSQNLHFQLKSSQHFPSNLELITWLRQWFVRNKMYEKSIQFYEQGSKNEHFICYYF